ncbi:MAG: TIGR03862 family flavoprotein [Pseudomonadota bacterium]
MASDFLDVDVAVIGGGPAGLMAAERASAAGFDVHVFERMPSLGRKLLMAGKSGLNLTKASGPETFTDAYFKLDPVLKRAVSDFGPDAVIDWCEALGVETFVGSSGRVFPKEMKASPLLRAWLRRLSDCGVDFHTRHEWTGFDVADFIFAREEGGLRVIARAVVFALGGGSWARLGSRGDWAGRFEDKDVEVHPFRPTNCGFICAWDDHFRTRFAGAPVKGVALSYAGRTVRGDFVITDTGVEGGAIYSLSAPLRDACLETGEARLEIDLLPDQPLDRLAEKLARPRGKTSRANHLRKMAGLKGVKAGLLRLGMPDLDWDDVRAVAARIKGLPLRVSAPRPLDEAISTAGGVSADAITPDFMLKTMPGVFVAGEMLDWDAPTGGYLLSACLASGRAAGDGVVRYLTGCP